jgi:hypothetical protein
MSGNVVGHTKATSKISEIRGEWWLAAGVRLVEPALPRKLKSEEVWTVPEEIIFLN